MSIFAFYHYLATFYTALSFNSYFLIPVIIVIKALIISYIPIILNSILLLDKTLTQNVFAVYYTY